MKLRAFTLIFFCFIFSCVCAQDQSRIRIETWYDLGKKHPKEVFYVSKKDPKTPDSLYLSWYQNGHPKSEGNFQKGKANGTWKYYYENGNLKMEGPMQNNTAEGTWTYYYENGQPSMSGLMKQGKKDGAWKHYYETGLSKSEGSYVMDQRQGDWVYYYEDGLLKAKATFDHDDGTYTEYYTNNSIKSTGQLKGGKSAGIWTYYTEEGDLQAEGEEKDGNKEGHWKFYHRNGVVSSEGNYEHGLPQGEWSYYDEQGNLTAKGQQKDGQKDGQWKSYYPSGQFKGEGTFVSGNGPYKEYYENGALHIEGNLKNSKSDGLWTYYYETGEKEGECNFEGGVGLYRGYYPSGKLKMEGKLRDGYRIGVWTLYNEDGDITGYYSTYYENDSPEFKEIKDSVVVPKDSLKPAVLPPGRRPNKKLRWFKPQVNEFHGVIAGMNPLGPFRQQLPLYIEYYYQERLGYEMNYTLIRDPFFTSHNRMDLEELYRTGYSVHLRQKMYNKDNDRGMFWFGHELRYTRINNSIKHIDTFISFTEPILLRKYQNQLEYSILIGDRLTRDAKHQGFTMDIFVGLGIGYRFINNSWEGDNKEYDATFAEVNQGTIFVPLRVGFSVGYIFKVQR